MARATPLLALALTGCATATSPAPATPVPRTVAAPAHELADAPPDTAVLEREGACWMADDQPVACPATIVAPDPPLISHGDERIEFDPHTFGCTTMGRREPCPDALLPRLADGVTPSRQNGADCALGATRVACPH